MIGQEASNGQVPQVGEAPQADQAPHAEQVNLEANGNGANNLDSALETTDPNQGVSLHEATVNPKSAKILDEPLPNAPATGVASTDTPEKGGTASQEPRLKMGSVFRELEFTPDFAALSHLRSPADLSWNNIKLSIKGKDILKGVSGHVGSHEMCCLLGPSGAGKSSLANVLAGRVQAKKGTEISGTMKVNGKVTSPVEFRRNVSYVMQEDCLFATATTREALEFSAKLRLPPTVSALERKKIVDELLKALGLTHVEHTLCGNELVRGLSGGEKKRVAIGVELVTSPQILFLDEPTSGLDAWSAFQVVSVLRSLSQSGCAVLCTIHQPSSETFSVFDRALVLAKGSILFNGPVVKMSDMLEHAGYPVPELTNPADYVILLSQTIKGEMPHITENMEDKIEGTRGESGFGGEGKEFVGASQASGWLQMKELSIREFRNLKRDKGALIGRFGITIFLNLLFGWIFYGAANVDAPEGEYSSRGHLGGLFNVLVAALFGAAQPPLLTFPLERVVFLREYSTGSYNAVAYFISKILVEIPITFLTSAVIAVATYWIVDFQANFGAFVLILFLLQMTIASYSYLLGALVSTPKMAQELSSLIFVPQLLFGGFFIPISQIPESIRWVQYLCSLKYSMNLAILAELGGQQCRGENGPFADERVAQCQALVLESDIDSDLTWLYVVVLLVIFVVFRVISLGVLVWRANNFST